MSKLKNIIKLTKNIKLLYVEYDENSREASLGIFETFFDTIIIADDGQDGLDKFNENKIDLIITDISMPKMNTLEMLKIIKEKDTRVKILLLSAHYEMNYFKQAVELGVDAYLLKPLELNLFIDAIYKIVKNIDLKLQLKENINLLKQYQYVADEAIIVSKTDPFGIITHVNNKFCEVSEYTKEELLQSNHNIIRYPDNSSEIFKDLWYVIKKEKKTWKGVIRNLSKSGKIYYVETTIKPLLDRDGNILEFIALRYDITNVMSQKKQLLDFINASSKSFLVSLKIEDFNDIYKYYGEESSQEITQKLAVILKENMPNEFSLDLFYDLSEGCYSFVHKNRDALLVNNSFDTIIEKIKEFQLTINNLTINVNDIFYDVSILVTLSFGDAIYEDAKFAMDKLLEENQTFLIGNGLAKSIHTTAKKNLDMLVKVKNAMQKDKIVSYFQVIVDKNEKAVKYESLVRLIEEDNSVISPDIFLDIAKKAKYYTNITSIVLRNSFNALKITDRDISINISIIDIEKQQMQKEIFELLEQHKNDTSRIVFELLEDEDAKDFKLIKKFIKEVKSYGVKIAIDDFGSGYSNYERLLDYQPDIIKIDGSLVKDVASSKFCVSVITSIIVFAKKNNVEIVAEYVENEEIFHILKDLGVDYFQGYFFGKPEVLADA